MRQYMDGGTRARHLHQTQGKPHLRLSPRLSHHKGLALLAHAFAVLVLFARHAKRLWTKGEQSRCIRLSKHHSQPQNRTTKLGFGCLCVSPMCLISRSVNGDARSFLELCQSLAARRISTWEGKEGNGRGWGAGGIPFTGHLVHTVQGGNIAGDE